MTTILIINICRAFFKAIHEWFSTKDSSFNSFMFQGTFLHNMRVIWYELPDNEDETESFTRLNLGKIPLTNAELIKHCS